MSDVVHNPPQAEDDTPVEVRLLTTTRVHAGFEKLVGVELAQERQGETLVKDLPEGLEVEPALVGTSPILVVKNKGGSPLVVEAGAVIGLAVNVTKVEEVPAEQVSVDSDNPVCDCCRVEVKQDTERNVRLARALSLDTTQLTLEQRDRLPWCWSLQTCLHWMEKN